MDADTVITVEVVTRYGTITLLAREATAKRDPSGVINLDTRLTPISVPTQLEPGEASIPFWRLDFSHPLRSGYIALI